MNAGCMNAFAHYALLLAKQDHTPAEETTLLRTRAKEVYARLEEADHDRKERYRDMGKLISAFSGLGSMAKLTL